MTSEAFGSAKEAGCREAPILVGAEAELSSWYTAGREEAPSERLAVLIDLGRVLLLGGTSKLSGALGSALSSMLDREILALDPSRIKEALSRELPIEDVLDVLRGVGARDAMNAIISSLKFEDHSPAAKHRMLKAAFNVDLAGGHSWIGDLDIRQDRIAMYKFVVQPIKSNPLFQMLKAIEAEALVRSGAVPGLQKVIDLVRNREGLAGSSETAEDAFEKSPSMPFIHPAHQLLQALAFHAPEICRELIKRRDAGFILRHRDALSRLIPVYMVITDLGYPMGGGESFMHQTCKIMSELGYRCIWVSFSFQGVPYDKDNYATTPYFEEARIAGGISAASIEATIRRFRPDIIHTQGASNPLVTVAAARERIPVLVGYHFWNGLVRLGSNRANSKILDWIELHRPVEDILANRRTAARAYVASEFMLDVYRRAGGRNELSVFHPISDPSHYLVDEHQLGDKVVQVNIAQGKGGAILLKAIETLGHKIPFYVVQTEPHSGQLDNDIKKAIEQRPLSQYRSYGSIKKHFRAARLVIVPTIVDETFCRVAFEAAMNGIPVISTANGFLPQMLGDTGVFLSENPSEWITTIEEVYSDVPRLKEIGRKQKQHLLSQFGYYPAAFVNAVIEMSAKAPKRNIGIFVPWSEQGLGEVARNYSRLFRRMGFKVHILSFQAYAARDRGLAVQQAPEDWAVGTWADTVYYSFNDRERVTLHELEQFTLANSVGVFIYPEICFRNNWLKVKNYRVSNLDIIAVPMAETVRRSEVIEHNSLSATWFNTRQCADVLSRAGVKNGIYVGYGFGASMGEAEILAKVAQLRRRDKLVFSHIGGHNPISRKQTPLVIEAFRRAAQRRKDIFLRVCVMGAAAGSLSEAEHDQIEFAFKTMTHEQILDIYRTSDVSIQVSSHEGLGLGFYESISVGTPVLSLDIAPHNEVVRSGVSGWLLPAKPFELTDNNEALVTGGRLDPDDLARAIVSITRQEAQEAIASTAEFFNSTFCETEFSMRLATGLNTRKSQMLVGLADTA